MTCQVRLKDECSGKADYRLPDSRICCRVCLICVGSEGAVRIDEPAAVGLEQPFIDKRAALSMAPAGMRWD